MKCFFCGIEPILLIKMHPSRVKTEWLTPRGDYVEGLTRKILKFSTNISNRPRTYWITFSQNYIFGNPYECWNRSVMIWYYTPWKWFTINCIFWLIFRVSRLNWSSNKLPKLLLQQFLVISHLKIYFGRRNNNWIHDVFQSCWRFPLSTCVDNGRETSASGSCPLPFQSLIDLAKWPTRSIIEVTGLLLFLQWKIRLEVVSFDELLVLRSSNTS